MLFRSFCAAFLLPTSAFAQGALDLFPNAVDLGDGFVRLGAWNLRHLNLEGGAAAVLPGTTDDQDFQSLVGTFANAIDDLSLDLVAIVEHQPRQNEPNRLNEVRDRLAAITGQPWSVDETQIPYDQPTGQFGGLQFGILWKPSKVTIDASADLLLSDLRQPRSGGILTEQTTRVPWLIPVQAGSLSFDLMVLHLKSGGEAPQAAEVDAIEGFVRARFAGPNPRHLVVCGDWNIRPDTGSGRGRLRQMMVPGTNGPLMRVLTVEDVLPSLEQWESLGTIAADSATAGLLPFTHYNATSLDTFLDHIAISRTLDEVFDNPIRVTLSDGTEDLRPGIEVVRPMMPEAQYRELTDHLPVVLVLRTSGGVVTDPPPPVQPMGGLRIVAAVPNPTGDDALFEEVRVRNFGATAVSLASWRVGDSTTDGFWILAAADGTVAVGGTTTIVRQGRGMSLNNDGDVIRLVDPANQEVDRKVYSSAASGAVITFVP